MATIELYGIKAEVPEGHPDFWFRDDAHPCWMFIIVEKERGKISCPIPFLFCDYERDKYYWQRRVVEAARCWFYDYAEELQSRYEEIGGGRPWTKEDDDQAKALLTEIRAAEHEADHWQLIGEAAEKEADNDNDD